MNKTQYYLSQCANAAAKSPMCFTLGAIMVKGGKVISAGHNHYRTHYDGNDLATSRHRKPVSMHAEMHAIYAITGMFKPLRGRLREKNRTNRVNYGPNKRKQARQPSQDRINRPRDESPRRSSEELAVDDCALPPLMYNPGKGWDVRRRDPRVNGADIYVARTTKNGMGDAKPCWRCLEWCRWAGVKRVFHWNSEEGRFDMVKVNSEGRENYETRADSRLFSGHALR
ncbi:hypothetical protein BDW22DRAFT_1347992 [Trametopsis cervina]|nr:hypothetical protein BDW22DRAFT_1347992 [Trametopsis cervina]